MQVLAAVPCQEKWSGTLDFTEYMACVESKDGTACNGDEWGPVMVLGRSTVYRLLSTFAMCCPADNTRQLNIYADATAALGWIEENVE